MKFCLSVSLALLISACATSEKTAGTGVHDGTERSRVPSSSSEQPPLFPGEIWGPEQDDIAKRIVQSSIAIAQKNAGGGPVHRDAHPKHHGCVKAHWKTEDLVSEVGSHAGLLSQPGGEYDAWIRFSNGSPEGENGNDGDADVRGMAIKLMRVAETPRGSQDFLLMTSPTFFSRDAEDYMNFNEAIMGGKLKLGEYMVMHPLNAKIIFQARVHLTNPLAQTYFGPVPSRIGDFSMRTKAVPCAALPSLPADPANPNFLRTNLVKTLATQPACYDFYVQINRDPQTNSVEDPRKLWSEATSPYKLAARITIPEQTGIDSPEQLAFCENVSMDPWNSQDELRPLGQINRIRKAVYPGVSNYRHQKNGVPREEPTHF